MTYQYDYPRPMVTVDVLVIRNQPARRKVELLFIQRGGEPFRNAWALPGGFLEMSETLSEAACRELAEETGISGLPLAFLEMADAPGRDPRGRTLSAVYAAFAPANLAVKAGSDASGLGWFSLDALPRLAFDHQEIVSRLLQKIRVRLLTHGWILECLPGQFRLADVQTILDMWDLKKVSGDGVVKRLVRAGFVEALDDGKFEKKLALSPLNWPESNQLAIFLGKPIDFITKK